VVETGLVVPRAWSKAETNLVLVQTATGPALSELVEAVAFVQSSIVWSEQQELVGQMAGCQMALAEQVAFRMASKVLVQIVRLAGSQPVVVAVEELK
jgi:hypothetical protein